MGISYSKKTNFKKYGWIRDHSDLRDKTIEFNQYSIFSQIDLRDKFPTIYNQDKLGCCCANAIASVYEYNLNISEKKIFKPSRLFIYFNEREIENTIDSDSGSSIRNGIQAIKKFGIIPEKYWPYNINKFNLKPSNNIYSIASKNKSIKYSRVNQNIDDIRQVLENNIPIIFGFNVYESFENEETRSTGMMSLPNRNEKFLGGQIVVAVGYNDSLKIIIVRNSRGIKWGDKGYFYMPYEYITNSNLSGDFWVIENTFSNNLYPNLDNYD